MNNLIPLILQLLEMLIAHTSTSMNAGDTATIQGKWGELLKLISDAKTEAESVIKGGETIVTDAEQIFTVGSDVSPATSSAPVVVASDPAPVQAAPSPAPGIVGSLESAGLSFLHGLGL